MSTKAKSPGSAIKAKKAGSLPAKAVLDELKHVRAALRDILKNYAREWDGGLAAVVDSVTKTAKAKSLSKERAHDLRDLLAVVRGVDIKPAKGRRRDLKKIESAVQDARLIVERW